MESDVTTMKKRIMESKQNEKSMKQTIRLQRDKSRQLITACAFKLQEKEAEVESPVVGGLPDYPNLLLP